MNRFIKLSLIIAVLAMPGMAFATHIVACRGDADCTGWTKEVDIQWRMQPYVSMADISYTVTLTDASGAVVKTFNYNGVVHRTADVDTHFFSDVWGMELCGDYTAHFYFYLSSEYAPDTFDTSECEGSHSFTCDCQVDSCNFTPGYWKNHLEAWPDAAFDSEGKMSLGCASFDRTHLLAILNTPVRGDATIILAYHLIAAKLNVANGSDPSIGGAIAEADALLCEYPLRTKPSGDARDMILDVKNMLAGYNELGCGDEEMPDKALPDETSSSWGELKANYR